MRLIQNEIQTLMGLPLTGANKNKGTSSQLDSLIYSSVVGAMMETVQGFLKVSKLANKGQFE